MLIIPAIDLKDGHCVRLQQGRMDSATVFSEHPVAMAKDWSAEGARRLHIVDLNGAVAGRPKNEKVIREMIKAVGEKTPIQIGGRALALKPDPRLMPEVTDSRVLFSQPQAICA